MKDWLGSGTTLAQLSWICAFSVLLPLGLGILLDRLLHTSPLFLFAGAALGIIAGTVGTVRTATRTIAELETAHQSRPDGVVQKEDPA